MIGHGRFRDKIKMGWMVLTALVVVALLSSGCNAQKSKVYRVGVLSGMSFAAEVTDGFKAGMTELGYVEGENIVYDVQETEFDVAAYQRIIEEFIADEVDLMVVFPTEPAIEAKAITEERKSDIPVIFAYFVLKGMDLVDSVREPGGHYTGVRYPATDVVVKRFDMLRTIAPETERVCIPYQRDYPIVEEQLEVLYPLAAAEGVTLIEFPADSAAELEAELEARAQQDDVGLDAILFLVEPLAVTPENFLVISSFAYERQIPLGGAYVEAEDYASLFGVRPGMFESGQQAAFQADKILNGVPAGTIPVVSPENFIQINYKAAQEMGLMVPENLLLEADEIIRDLPSER
jgi:putative ABC transport system substrate-binding protein